MCYLFVRNHEPEEGAWFKRFVMTTQYDEPLTYLSEFGRQSPGEYTGSLDSEIWYQRIHECRAEGTWIQTGHMRHVSCFAAVRSLINQEDV